jgi:hypothetical protein
VHGSQAAHVHGEVGATTERHDVVHECMRASVGAMHGHVRAWALARGERGPDRRSLAGSEIEGNGEMAG